MSDRNKRLKAQDVFNQTKYFATEKTSSFDVAFPKIEAVKVKVIERCNFQANESTYTKRSLPGEFINCHNPRCYNGGLPIGRLIRNMEYGNETFLEGKCFCQGYEGSPKGRKNYGPCDHMFEYTITVDYKK